MFRQAESSRRMLAITSETSNSLGTSRWTAHLVCSGNHGHATHDARELPHNVTLVLAHRRELIPIDVLVQAEQMSLELLL